MCVGLTSPWTSWDSIPGCVLGPHGARRTCLCGWRVVSGDTPPAVLFLEPKHPVTAALTLQTDWIQPQQAALCVMQNPQTDQVGRGPQYSCSDSAPAPGTGHPGRRNHETPSSQKRSLHPPPSSDLRGARNSEMPAGGEGPDSFIFLWIKADFQRTRSVKTRGWLPGSGCLDPFPSGFLKLLLNEVLACGLLCPSFLVLSRHLSQITELNTLDL